MDFIEDDNPFIVVVDIAFCDVELALTEDFDLDLLADFDELFALVFLVVFAFDFDELDLDLFVAVTVPIVFDFNDEDAIS